MTEKVELVNSKIALFEGKEVRKIIYNDEWWFSVVDIVGVLDISNDSRNYWKVLKHRLIKEGSNQTVTNCNQLKLLASDNKMRFTDCANTETCLRIIQSIPSPKAEPFKQWLAKVGYERIKEIEDPELSMNRMIETYEKKGYPKEWIDVRTRGVPVRKGLTNEWDERGGEGVGYGILTNEVYKAYSGMINQQWKDLKGMDKGNLRDGMTPTELILTMLVEQATTDITRSRDSKGIPELKKASKDGGGVAFKAREELIDQTGTDPINGKNYLKELKKNTRRTIDEKKKK